MHLKKLPTSQYVTSIVHRGNSYAYIIALLSHEIDVLTFGTIAENDYHFSEIMLAFHGDIDIETENSLLVVSHEKLLSKYAILQIKWDKIEIVNSPLLSHFTLYQHWYPYHTSFSSIERLAWNQLVKVVLSRLN